MPDPAAEDPAGVPREPEDLDNTQEVPRIDAPLAGDDGPGGRVRVDGGEDADPEDDGDGAPADDVFHRLGERVADGWAAFLELPRVLRRIAQGLVALVLVVVLLTLAGVVVARRPLPQTGGDATVSGLASPVTVVRDDHGVPQLYGSSVADLARAQGYVQAQDRFVEMDLRRRQAEGRLAELLGADALPSDRAARTIGLDDVAARSLALLQPRTRTFLDAYAAGVNAYLADRGGSEVSVEYGLLGLRDVDGPPQPWRPTDSLAVLLLSAWQASGSVDDEVQRVVARQALDPTRAATLDPRGRRPGRLAARLSPLDVDLLQASEQALSALPSYAGGSDPLGSAAVALAPSRTTTGGALLADAPVQGVGSLGATVQVGLHCQPVTATCPLDVSGLGYAGMPGVVVGHNGQVAFGRSDLGADVSDLVVERVTGRRYRLSSGRGDAPRDQRLLTRTETIDVRNADPVKMTVRSTARGPLVSDLVSRDADIGGATGEGGAQRPRVAFALHWTGLRAAPLADAVLDLDSARGWRQVRQALRSWTVPPTGWVYADAEGHVGYQAAGMVPDRPAGRGSVPTVGWRDGAAWDPLPFGSLPSVLDPPGGVVVSAGQAVAGAFPEPPSGPRGRTARLAEPGLTAGWDPGYRATRLDDLVDGRARTSSTQLLGDLDDQRDPLAKVLVPALLQVRLPRGYAQDGQALLRRWDGVDRADSPAAAYLAAVWRRLLADTFDDQLPAAARPDGSQRWIEVVDRLLRSADDPWWDDVDTAAVETRDDVLREAMLSARDDLTMLQARRAASWTWGHQHVVRLLAAPTAPDGRLLDGTGLPGALLSAGTTGVGGSEATVSATAWDPRRGFAVTTAPAARLVVDLAHPDRSLWVVQTGASAHFTDDHRSDQTPLWAAGGSIPWPSSRTAVDDSADQTLRLLPADD